MLRGLLTVGAALIVLQAACGEAAAQSTPAALATPATDGRLGIHGSNTIGAKLMPSIVEAYAASIGASVVRRAGADPEQVELRLTSRTGAPIALVDIRSHGSGTAVPGLISGQATIGMASRQITDKEVEALAKAGWPDLRQPEFEHVLALDGVLVLVAADNPLASLSMEQVAAIFAGTVRDWADVGRSPGGPVNIYARDNKSGTWDTFNALVLQARKLALRKDAKRFESSEDLSDEVSRDPNGIGFVGFAYLRNAKALDITSDCGITSAPNTFNVKSEEYPLARRLFLYAKGLPKGSVADDIMRYALSLDARASITASGYIDQEFEFLDRKEQMLRLAGSLALNDADVDPVTLKQLALDIKSSTRMSTTFRFALGSSQLDSKSVLDVERLARFVEFLVESKRPNTIVLAGFSDPVGSFASNAALSQARALQVRDAIVRRAKVKVPPDMIVTRGFSKLLPTSCNDTEDGRHKNRRVEGWLR